jgi:hypothetical protein
MFVCANSSADENVLELTFLSALHMKLTPFSVREMMFFSIGTPVTPDFEKRVDLMSALLVGAKGGTRTPTVLPARS